MDWINIWNSGVFCHAVCSSVGKALSWIPNDAQTRLEIGRYRLLSDAFFLFRLLEMIWEDVFCSKRYNKIHVFDHMPCQGSLHWWVNCHSNQRYSTVGEQHTMGYDWVPPCFCCLRICFSYTLLESRNYMQCIDTGMVLNFWWMQRIVAQYL